jgi:hypothetical protein
MSLNRNADLTGTSGGHPAVVEAVLNYLAPTRERPRTYTNDPPAGEPRTTVVSEAHVLPIRNLPPFAPLAICDASTVSFDDPVPSDLIYPHRVGETYQVSYNPAHRWFYVPEMGADEALLLKCFDSKTDGRARFAPHSAFRDPTAPVDAPPRESVEVRTLVFHPA